MIPQNVGDIYALTSEVTRQTEEVRALFDGLTDAALLWRVDETRWSITGHFAHVGIVNHAYLNTIGDAVARARKRGGLEGDGPYRHPWITTRFAGSFEPPPRRRFQTFRSMVPDPGVSSSDALATFRGLQEELVRLMEQARGLDLGRVRFGSPFMALLRFSLGTGFATLLAHNRRHIWLSHEIMGLSEFPARG